MSDLRQLTQEYIDAFDDHDLDAVGTMLHDDFVLEDPAGRFAGKAAVLNYIAGIFRAEPALRFAGRSIFVDGTVSLIEFTLTLSSKVLVGTDVIEWRGEKLAALRAYLHEKP